MKMTSLTINGRTVSRLFINNREVALGSASCDALCFTAKSDQSMLSLSQTGSPDSINLQTSTNGISWTPYNVGDVITINSGEKVYFKAVGSNYKLANSSSDYHKFVTNGEFESSGNVNSLLEEDEATARTMSLYDRSFCYAFLFSDTSLTKAPELPATELAYSCYAMMFTNCTSLTTVPALPADTLADSCYLDMFSGCSSLTQAPELPATTLVDNCYQSMFSNCTSLDQAPALPATTLANNCYQNMFTNCSSLTQAPELPATTLASYCYAFMFYGCSQLNYVSVGFGNWVQYATDNWLPENTGTFVCRSTLINNTTERTTSTVPASWTMTV